MSALDTCPCGSGLEISHAEHHYEWIRLWCEKCVPMSGHYEWCPQECVRIIAKRRELPIGKRPMRSKDDSRVANFMKDQQ